MQKHAPTTVLCLIAVACGCTATNARGAATIEKVWLSDLDISKTQQGWGEPHPNTSVDGKPMKIGDCSISTGIADADGAWWSMGIPEEPKGFRLFWEDRPWMALANMCPISPKAFPAGRISLRRRSSRVPGSTRSVPVPSAATRLIGIRSLPAPCTLLGSSNSGIAVISETVA